MAEITGRWRLNDEGITPGFYASEAVEFIWNGFHCYRMNMFCNEEDKNSFTFSRESHASVHLIQIDAVLITDNSGTYYTPYSFCKEIDFGAALQTVSDEFFAWFNNNARFIGEGMWKPVWEASLADSMWYLREAYQYVNNKWAKISTIFKTYGVDLHYSNNMSVETGTYNFRIEVNSVLMNSNFISEDSICSFIFTADEGYSLPGSIAVSGASIVSWDKSTGALLINKPTGDVTITASAYEIIASEGLKFVPNGDGTCYLIASTLFALFASEDLIIPSTSPNGDIVTGIGNSAFANSWTTVSVTIPESVTDIGDSAFCKCSKLATVTIKGYLVTISSTAFGEKSDDNLCLTDIYVPWAEGEVTGAPWGATNATIHYNSVTE